MLDLWKGIRRRLMARDLHEPEATCSSLPSAVAFEKLIARCLELLRPYSAGTVLYTLNCLCPSEIIVLDICRLDLSLPHRHERLSGKKARLKHDSYEELLSQLRAYASIVPSADYSDFWLELTRSWLLTCPVDPDYYREDESGKELYCRRLRSELSDRILNIS